MLLNFFLNFDINKITGQLLEATVLYAPRLLFAVIIYFVGNWLIGVAEKLLRAAMSFRKMDGSLQSFLLSLISVVLKIVLLLFIADALGLQTNSLLAILGAASLAVGLALQGSLSNFAGGVLLLIFKPFKVGDLIQAQGEKGVVKEVQIFNTIIITADQRTVILPNGMVSNGIIVNLSDRNISVDITLPVSYEISFDFVQQQIMPLLLANPLVQAEPVPTIFVSKLSEESAILVIRCFTDAPNNSATVASVQTDLKRLVEQYPSMMPDKTQRVKLEKNV